MADSSCRQDVAKAAVDELIYGYGLDIAGGINAQSELRQVLRRMAEDLLTALFTIEAGIVARAVEGLVSRDIR
jgi:hypothetical protein